MADLKISQLTSATLPLAGTEVLPIVQSSSTKKVATDDLTVKNVRSNATTGILQIAGPGAGTTRTMTTPNANFTAARTDAAQSFTGDQTLGTGNLVIGTSGKGIDFSAASHAAGMTSELLDDYEEGTFTPAITTSNNDATVSSYATQQGRYVKVGNLVFCSIQIRANISAAGTGDPQISGLPYAPGGSSNAGTTIIYWDLFATKHGYTAYAPFGVLLDGNTTVSFPGAVWATGVNNYLYFTVVLRA